MLPWKNFASSGSILMTFISKSSSTGTVRVLIITLFDYPLNDDGGNTFLNDWVQFEAQSY